MSPPTPRRARSETVGRYRAFDVVRHTMVDGRDVFTFACPDWATVVPVTDAGEIVLVRQYRHGIDGETLETPGGVVDEGETPEQAAVRELREETGYEAMRVVSLGFTHPNPPLQGNRHHMFLATGARRVDIPRFDQGEYCEVVVVPADTVKRFMRDGTMTHALVVLALYRAFEVWSPGGP